MKTLILYYSHGGTTRSLAQQLAGETGADLVEVRYKKRPSMLGTIFRGVPAAMGQKPAKTEPITADFAAYERVILMAPVWAGHPAPPFNSMVQALPAGTAVELRLVSAGGDTAAAKDRVVAKVEAQGCTVAAYTDIKTPAQA